VHEIEVEKHGTQSEPRQPGSVLPSCAAMARPSFPARFLQTDPVQMAAGVSLKIAHDSLRRNFRLDHAMHVIASYMGRQQIPATMCTHALNRFQDGIAAKVVQVIGRLVHALFLVAGTSNIFFQNWAPRHIVRAIDRAASVATVASKRGSA
jgi:hypothetical protein